MELVSKLAPFTTRTWCLTGIGGGIIVAPSSSSEKGLRGINGESDISSGLAAVLGMDSKFGGRGGTAGFASGWRMKFDELLSVGGCTRLGDAGGVGTLDRRQISKKARI